MNFIINQPTIELIGETDNKAKKVSKWDKFYSRQNPYDFRDTFRDKIRIEIILDYIKWSKARNVLDMGCGEGSLTYAAAEFVQNISAFDISVNAIEYAKKDRSRPNINYFQLDITDFTHSSTVYDLIICTEVFYYLEDEEKRIFLSEVSKSLSEAGYFLLSSRVNFIPLDKHLELLSKDFCVISVIPVLVNKWKHKQIKRLCKYLHLNQIYKSFVASINPVDAGMCLFICIPSERGHFM